MPMTSKIRICKGCDKQIESVEDSHITENYEYLCESCYVDSVMDQYYAQVDAQITGGKK